MSLNRVLSVHSLVYDSANSCGAHVSGGAVSRRNCEGRITPALQRATVCQRAMPQRHNQSPSKEEAWAQQAKGPIFGEGPEMGRGMNPSLQQRVELYAAKNLPQLPENMKPHQDNHHSQERQQLPLHIFPKLIFGLSVCVNCHMLICLPLLTGVCGRAAAYLRRCFCG